MFVDIIAKVEKLLAGRFFGLKCALIGYACIFFFSNPSMFALSPELKVCGGCVDFQAKIDRKDYLLSTVTTRYTAGEHMGKSEFRLTFPLLCKLLHISNKYQAYALQLIIGLGTLMMAAYIFVSLLGSRFLAFCSVLAFCFIYAGKAAVIDTSGFLDAYSFFFILASMCSPHPILTLFTSQLAYWNDERAIFSHFLVMLWWQLKLSGSDGYHWKKILFPGIHSICIAISFLVYVFVRMILTQKYGFINSDGTMLCFPWTFKYSGLVLWQAFEGFIIIVFAALFILVHNRKYLAAGIFFLSLLLQYTVAMSIMDLTRSVAYIFPGIFIAYMICSQWIENKTYIKYGVCIALFYSFVFADYFIIVPREPSLHYPIYMKVIKKMMHIES
ncbi:MAG: hypothetical protein NW207_11615 [Cytophagales bacterium]|nr:hypothetical protein [Cytophagales bacterium]